MSDYSVKSSLPILGFDLRGNLKNDKYYINLDTSGESESVRANHVMQIDFRKEELRDLLAQPECVGIQLRPALDSKGKPSLLMKGIGIGSWKSSKGSFTTSTRRIMELNQRNFPDSNLTEDKSYISEGMKPARKGNEVLPRGRDRDLISKMIK